jgi:hypothetical protein
MIVDRTPEIATLLRQKPAAERRIQGIGPHNATKAALDVLRGIEFLDQGLLIRARGDERCRRLRNAHQ